ncbi:MAG: hypothetical protein HZA46_17440 [Planctomycetales bacterium]|nr:hypothetical protein [Planctomycetales bacterium]
MSLTAALIWTCLRSLTIALVAWPVSCFLSTAWHASRGQTRRGLIVLLFIPFLFPELWVGYAYANFWLSLIHHPEWNELLFDLLLLLKLVPAGTVVFHFSPPPPLSAQALHCRRLAIFPDSGWRTKLAEYFGGLLRGPLRAAFPALALVFLLAFQEYDLASLMGVKTWSVWLFDAQAGSRDATLALHHIAWPLACESVVLLPALVVAWANSGWSTSSPEATRPLSRIGQAWLWGYLVVAVTLTTVVPIALTGRGLWTGFQQLMGSQVFLDSLISNIASGFVVAAIAAGAASGLAAVVLRQSRRQIAWLCLLPGGLGSLVVGLMVLVLFQRTPLHVVYDTPLPLVVALSAWLLPRAVLLQLLWLGIRKSESTHLAGLLQWSPTPIVAARGIDLLWQLHSRPTWFCWMALSYWAYLDLTSAAILAPTGMASATVRLYDLMHFGRTSLLSAATCLTLLLPAVALWLCVSLRRQVFRWFAV